MKIKRLISRTPPLPFLGESVCDLTCLCVLFVPLGRVAEALSPWASVIVTQNGIVCLSLLPQGP